MVYTTGMSDLPMTLPEEIKEREDLQYAELFIFMPPEWNPGEIGQTASNMEEKDYWVIQMMKFLARFPHEYHTWLGGGHTVPNGPQYAPICEGTKMGGVVLSQMGGELGSLKTKDGAEINLLMMIPAYQEEIEYKLKYGMEALDKKYSEENLPTILDIHRPNYCADFTERLD